MYKGPKKKKEKKKTKNGNYLAGQLHIQSQQQSH